MQLSIKFRREGNSILIVTVLLLGIVLYLGNLHAVNTSKIVDLICLVSFPFMSVTGVLAVISFLIPVNSGITVLYIYGYAILVLLWKNKRISAKVLLTTAVILVYEWIMSAFVPNVDMQSMLIYCLTWFLLLYMMDIVDVDYKLCCYAYIVGAMVLLLSVMTTAIQHTSLQMVLSGSFRIGTYGDLESLGGRVAIISENANSLAYYALVAVIIAFSLIKNENMIGKILLISAAIFGIVVGLFSVSRTFLLVLVFGIFLVFIVRYDFKQKIALTIVVSLILYIGVPYLLDKTSILNAFQDRFTDSAAARGSGRLDLFIEYMEFLWNNPVRLIFGTGAVNYKTVCGCSNSVHCGIEQILVSYGVVGFLPVIFILLHPIFVSARREKFRVDRIIPLICVIVFTQTIQFLNPYNLMLPYAVAIMFMKIPSKDECQ